MVNNKLFQVHNCGGLGESVLYVNEEEKVLLDPYGGTNEQERRAPVVIYLAKFQHALIRHNSLK